MENISDLIQSRNSQRTYKSELLSDDLIEKIEQILNDCPPGPFKNESSFILIHKSMAADQKIKLGTYGMISDAQYFIAGKTVPVPGAFIDFGYRMEWIILQLTALGLGTCWLGGTLKRNEFAKFLDLGKNEIIPAITPVGYPVDKIPFKDRLVRFGAGSNSRKPWSEIFFNESVDNPLTDMDSGKYSQVLEMVRLAPSASNKQPWRIIKKNDAFHFYIQRTSGYGHLFPQIDLQKVDIGIVLCHFDLMVKELSLPGNWVNLPDKSAEFNKLEYVISWEMTD